MKQAWAYLRTSSETNKDSHSFERQSESIKIWAKHAKVVITRSFQEIYTGTAEDRPVFTDMLEKMMADGVSTFVVENQTRLGRDLLVNLHLIAQCKKLGISIIDAQTSDDLTRQEDPMSLAMTQIQGVFAQLEKSQLVAKLKKARDAKSKTLGRRIEGRKKHEYSEEVLQLAKKLRRKHKGRRRPSLETVANKLNKLGFSRPSGLPFDFYTVSRMLG